MRVFFIAFIIAISTGMAASAAESIFLENPRDVLADLDSVFVYAKSFDETPDKNNVYEYELRDYAAYILRHYGVHILTEEQITRIPGKPVVRVTLNTMKVTNTMHTYSYHLSVSLQEVVSLQRNPGVTSRAITWQQWKIGTAEDNSMSRVIKDDLRAIMEAMVKDYVRDVPKVNRY